MLFGPGEENIVWAFQIAFVFALTLGFAHLILSDHDGPIDRRDWFGLAAGAAGLMSSGLSLVMIAVVGISVLLRRGWRLAAFHTVPLALMYLTWYLATDPGGIDNPFGRSATPRELLEFVWSGVTAGLSSIGGSDVTAWVLATLLVAGVVAAVSSEQPWRRLVPSVACMAGAIMFLVGTGYTRWFVTPTVGNQGRYLYTLAALALPLIAVAADALIRRASSPARWYVAPLVLTPIVVGLLLKLDGFGGRDPFGRDYHQTQEAVVLSLAHLDEARDVPAYVRPNPWFTIGWLREAAEDGKVPQPPKGAERVREDLPPHDRSGPAAR